MGLVSERVRPGAEPCPQSHWKLTHHMQQQLPACGNSRAGLLWLEAGPRARHEVLWLCGHMSIH